MFDDTIAKNMDNPASYTGTNKLLYTSDSKSNVTSLGENTDSSKTGLSAFNDVIKKSIKYLYLNNNSFSNVNALKDFTVVTELQLMCNANLYNIDALTNHTQITELTLHNCALTSIGSYDVATGKYSGGLTGCSGITKLSVGSNSGLTNLIGIESATDMVYLLADGCNLTDISSLTGKSKISYLKLANNLNLKNVRYIGYCSNLNYIYLDNNTEMLNTELNIALNGADSTITAIALIKNCKNSYTNIPKKYWELFLEMATVLNYSRAALGKYLTVDSIEWIKIKGRTDITKLALDGQIYLSMDDVITNEEDENGVTSSSTAYGIKSTLKTLTGIKALSLYNCSQVTSIDFVKPTYDSTGEVLISGMPDLYEIDLRNVSTSLTNLSAINDCTALNRLIVNNSNIDATKIQTAINRFVSESGTTDNTWRTTASYNCSGYVAEYDTFPDFSECSEITSFKGGNIYYSSDEAGELDLSGTKITRFSYFVRSSMTISLPETCDYIYLDQAKDITLNLQKTSGITIGGNWFGNATISRISEMNISNVSWDGGCIIGKVYINSNFLNKFSAMYLNGHSRDYEIDLTNVSNAENITILSLTQMKLVTGLANIGNLKNLRTLNLSLDGIQDISWISSLSNLQSLNLSNNQLINVTALSDFKMKRTVKNGVSVAEGIINLSTNYITDITPLAEAISEDGLIGYYNLNISNNSLDGYTVADNITALLKLHAAGLKKVTITGNNFSENEVNELINGKTVKNADGTETVYAGFGSGNVIN